MASWLRGWWCPTFGLPLPEEGPHIGSWLRLKGVRDIASGLAVLAFMVWGGSHMVGIILLVEAHHPHRRHAGHSCGEGLGEVLRRLHPGGTTIPHAIPTSSSGPLAAGRALR